MKKILCILMVLCVSVSSLSQYQKPGFKTTLSQEGLSYIKDVGVQVLQDYLNKSIPVPPIIGQADTPFGTLQYSLTDVVLYSLKIEDSAVALLPKISAAQLDIINASAYATLKWEFNQDSFPHFTDHGLATITVFDTSGQISMRFTADNGRPAAQVIDTVIEIGTVDIVTQGDASWLYNLFVDDLASYIIDKVADALEEAIGSAVEDGTNQALASLPITVQINDDLVVDYSLTDSPLISSNYLTLSHKGEFYTLENHQETPFSIPDLPNSGSQDMVQMKISDYVANSIAFSLYLEHRLEVVLTDATVPEGSPIHLNTTDFQDLVPPLYKKYPHMLMSLDVQATQYPFITFGKNASFVKAKCSVDVYVEPSHQLAFSLDTDLYFAGLAAIKGMNITGDLQLLNVSLRLQSSRIGSFDVSVLQDFTNLLFKYGVLPIVNNLMHVGFPLPYVEGLSFVGPKVSWGPRYLLVSSNIQYQPDVLRKKLYNV